MAYALFLSNHVDKFVKRGRLRSSKRTKHHGDTDMTYTNEIGKTFTVKEVNGKFFYWSPRAVRWFPVAKSKVSA